MTTLSRPVDLRLYVLLDSGCTDRASLPALACAAVAGGATLLQYRDKSAETGILVETTRAIREATGGGVPLIVDDRVDVALAAGADGVHLGQDDMEAHDARRLLGASAIIGISVTREDHARALKGAPVDYACVGAVFAATSKENTRTPIGLEGLANLAEIVRKVRPDLPVGAIAGIDRVNARSVIAAGADGIAVISAVGRAPDPRAAARQLRETVDRTLAARGAAHRPGTDDEGPTLRTPTMRTRQ